MEKTKETIAKAEEAKTETEETLEFPTMLDEARKVISELKAANAEKKLLLDREEKLKATMMLAGRADAGKPVPKEETPKEYRDRIMRGG